MRDRHIKGQRRRVEHRRFNEGFMLHASTSPFYPLFASLDVGAQMMKGRSGRGPLGRYDPARDRIAQEAARDPARIRGEGERSRAALVLRALRARQRVRFPTRRSRRAHEVPWESVPTDELARDARYWALDARRDLARISAMSGRALR